MTSTLIIVSLSILALVATGSSIYLWAARRKISARIARLNHETLEASRDASVGHRLTIPNDPETAQLAHTVNRLFDALGERPDAPALAAIRRELNAWRYIERLIEQLDPDYDPARADFGR